MQGECFGWGLREMVCLRLVVTFGIVVTFNVLYLGLGLVIG